MDAGTALAGVIASLFALTTAMLIAQQKAQGVVVTVLQTALTNCQTEKADCVMDNRNTVQKSYGLLTAFNDLKAVAMKMADNQENILVKVASLERRIDEDLKKNRGE